MGFASKAHVLGKYNTESMHSPRTITQAQPGDNATLVTTLALAFQDDPAFSWIVPDVARRAEMLRRYFAIIVPLDCAEGLALSAPQGEVATLWRAPGKAHIELGTMLRHGLPLLAAFGTALPRALKVSAAVEAHHPTTGPYWYLHNVGTRPADQGKGWGGAAIRAGLAHARADGLPVFLETATLSNVGLYQSLGFAVVQEWDVPGGGPHFWSMQSPAPLPG